MIPLFDLGSGVAGTAQGKVRSPGRLCYYDPRGMNDNRTLASCHTPRLNRFLSAARQLTLDLGGQWRRRAPEPGTERYAPMVGESGIRLEQEGARFSRLLCEL